jgi:hypothetical protein
MTQDQFQKLHEEAQDVQGVVSEMNVHLLQQIEMFQKSQDEKFKETINSLSLVKRKSVE